MHACIGLVCSCDAQTTPPNLPPTLDVIPLHHTTTTSANSYPAARSFQTFLLLADDAEGTKLDVL